MKKSFHSITLFLTILFITSCDNSKSSLDTLYNEIPIIEISPSENKTNLSVIFEKEYKIIKLESLENNLIGQVNKSYFDSSLIILLDKNQTMSLFFFSDKGEFLFRIADYGEGPDKYNEIGSFSIDREKEEVKLSQTFPSKFFIYNLNGVLKEISSINEYAWDFMETTNGNIWLYTFNNTTSEESSYNLLYTDNQGNTISKYLKSVPEDPTQLHSMVNNFFQYSDSLSFMLPFRNIIYDLSSETVRPKYRIVFQGDEISDNFFEKYYSEVQSLSKNLMKLINYFEKNEMAYNIESFYETENKLILQYHFKRKINFTVFDKKSSTYISTSQFKNDINKLDCNFIYSNFNPENDELIQFIDAYSFKNQMSKILQNLNKEELSDYKNTHKRLIDIYKNTQNMDNPILIKYKLKK